jgi:hypothetical protein
MGVPDRKFMSEVSMALCAACWFAASPSARMSDGGVTQDQAKPSSQCHTYLTAQGSASSIDPNARRNA